jgi:hypothetical protein
VNPGFQIMKNKVKPVVIGGGGGNQASYFNNSAKNSFNMLPGPGDYRRIP